jgi:metal-responsive CopG/Arc/MetJ family transcriptional regulator
MLGGFRIVQCLTASITFVILIAMKTAISLPDPLFEAAEQFAQENGLSRSELFARAVQLYLQTYRYQGITDALNQIYAEEPSTLDPALAAAQTRALPKEDW